MSTATRHKLEMLRTLPSDAARQIQWSFADRYELQMLVQSVRAVARVRLLRLVAQGGRNTHEWTPAKAEMLEALTSRASRRFLWIPNKVDSLRTPEPRVGACGL